MEKTTQILIASTTFHCTEEAYDRLFSYLERLRAHFRNESDQEEIMRDIESRVAEKLLEQKKTVITTTDVTDVINEIGEVSQLEDDVESVAADSPDKPGKHLYRDPDNAILAGVASGIAAYFDVSAIYIRLIFLATIFFGGTGILIYVLLWLVVPEAKTAAQKLEMRGKPVTFEAIGRVVKEGLEKGRSGSALNSLAGGVRRVIGNLLRFVSKAFGFFLSFGAFFSMIGLTVFLGVILTNWKAPFNDIPFRESSSDLLLNTTMFAGYLSAIIPLVLVFVLGLKLFRRHNFLSTTLGFGLIGVWALALIIAGVGGFKIAGDYYSYIKDNPEYAQITESRDLESFDRIVSENVNVRLEQGDTYRAVIEGRARDVVRANIEVKDGVLTLSADQPTESCLFCDQGWTNITIFAPTLTALEINGGSVVLEDLTAPQFQLEMNTGYISGDLNADRLSIISNRGSLHANVEVRELTIENSEANFYLSGQATTANIKLDSSTLYADSLVIENATLEADNSYAELDVQGTLTQDIDDESDIQLEGRSQTSGASLEETETQD